MQQKNAPATTTDSQNQSGASPADQADTLAHATKSLRTGEMAKAEALLQRILEDHPDQFDALRLMGVSRHLQDRNAEAADFFGKALAVEPRSGPTQYNLGVALAALGRHAEAVRHYQAALEHEPDDPEIHDALGGALAALDRHEEAEACFRRAIEGAPETAGTHVNLGVTLNHLGRYEEAEASLRRAAEIDPGSAEAHSNLGGVLKTLRRREDALASLRAALRIKPHLAETHNILGTLFLDLGRFEPAAASFREALRIDPRLARAHNNLGTALKRLKRYAEAIASYRRAFEIDPEHADSFSQWANLQRQVCDWSSYEETSRNLIARVQEGRLTVNPFSFLSVSDDPQVQLRCAQVYARRQFGSHNGAVTQMAARDDKRIRVAYVCANFREHATANHTAELFEMHDREQFEIVGISIGPDDESPIRQRLIEAFDDFIDVQGLSDRAIAETIAARKVHIAVDLMGHTTNSRPQVFAYRPAPVQVNYVAFPGTLGVDFIDYILVDPYVVPFDQQPFFSERLVHLPDCYWINDRKLEIAKRTPARAEAGLPEEGFVFCCFNNTYKITPELFDIWMRLLKAVPGSVLWLLGDNRLAEENLRREARARDVDPDRLVFAPRADLADHLARHRLADLFLDTLPYNAHTTARDALWPGLPLLTCPGRAFASRVAGSILHAIRLPELIADTLEDYEARALKLATDPEALNSVREKLAKHRLTTPFFASARSCRHMESAYQTMFETWRAGDPPAPFAVQPQPITAG